MSLEQFNKNSSFLSVLVCFLLDLLFIMLSYWPLTILAAIIGGLFCTEMKWGSLAGTLGILLAWFTTYDQLGRLIIGSSGAGGILVFIIFLVGALMGFLGGSIGSGIRMLTFPESSGSPENKL
jgi:hypothetical protein